MQRSGTFDAFLRRPGCSVQKTVSGPERKLRVMQPFGWAR